MILKQGDMWTAHTAEADLFCITTNSTLDRNGALIMGAGIAKQAKERYPRLPIWATQELRRKGRLGQDYHLLILKDVSFKSPLGLFQAKRDWKEPADLKLIEMNLKLLDAWCSAFTLQHNRAPVVHLNFPGVGLGGLKKADVLPLLAPLSDAVTVWEYAL